MYSKSKVLVATFTSAMLHAFASDVARSCKTTADSVYVLPKLRIKVYWEEGAWVETDITSKLLALPHFHIEENSVLHA